jgi:hypothetical protein
MKKTLTVVTLLAGAVVGYSQGLVEWDTHVTGVLLQPVFAQQQSDINSGTAVSFGGYTVYETIGNSTYEHELPTGTTTYTGAPLSGTGYDAELLVGPAGSTLASTGANAMTAFGGSTSSGAVIANFNTAVATVGYVNSVNSFALPSTAGGVQVEVAVAAWDNENGTVNSLATAQKDGDPWGISNVVNYTTGTAPSAPPNTLGIEAFDLGTATPEPSTIALGVMGASALLFRRRK